MSAEPATLRPRPHITTEQVASLLTPQKVAFIGASDKSAFSRIAFHNMKRFGAAKHCFLVNAHGAETHGVASYSSVAEIDEPIDLAFVMVSQAAIPGILRQVSEAGVRNVILLSSGYGETGQAGQEAQAELVGLAEDLGLLLLGPNMLGFANYVDNIPITAIPVRPNSNPTVALLSQSGASSEAMVDFAHMTGISLSYMVTLGNEAMLTAGHLVDFLVDDESTKAVAIFMESIRDPEVFCRAARRAAKAGKAIVVLKAGVSDLSARTAAAHTGALVGDDRVIDAVFRDLGVIRVDTIEDLLLVAGAAAHLGPLERPGIGIASISGGACDLIADRAAEMGAELPALAPETKERLGSFVASFGTIQNPLDVTGAAINDPTLLKKSILALADDPQIGVVGVVNNSLFWEGDPQDYPFRSGLQQIAEAMQEANVPTVYINQAIQPTTEVSKTLMREAGLPFVSSGLKSTVLAMHKLGAWSARRQEIMTGDSEPRETVVPEPRERRGKWSELRAHELLEQAGIPVVPALLATTPEEAITAAKNIGGPVAVKVVSAEIPHKSDIGGVKLGVEGTDAVRDAFEAVVAAGRTVEAAKIDGALVSPWRPPATELLVGVVRDPAFGLILAVAIGGVFVEVLDDSVLTPLPVSPERAMQLLGRLKAGKVLDGYRGEAAVDRIKLGDIISRIGDLALALGDDLVSLEVNPVRAHGTQIEALDALVEWRHP